MRLFLPLILVVSIASISIESSAQEVSVNPFARRIQEQKTVVETDPGKGDAGAWLKLAVLLQDAAQYSDSEQAYRKAIKLLKSGDRARLAEALDHMGTMYMESGRLSKAEPLERKALAIREEQNDLLGIAIGHMHLAVVLLGKREYPSAEAEAEMAVSLIIPANPHLAVRTAATPEERMTALIDLSLVKCARDECASAVSGLRRALGIAHANYPADSIPVGYVDFLLGYALWKSGDLGSAEEPMRNGTQELATQLGWGHPVYLRAMTQYKALLIQAGHTAEAEEVGARIASLKTPARQARAESNHAAIGLEQLP